MRSAFFVILTSFLTFTCSAVAEEAVPPAAAPVSQSNPMIEHHRSVYDGVTKLIVRSAELMPEEEFDFRPVESVRTFGQIVGHVADSQYFFCSKVLGEKNPAPRVEKTRTSKADLVAALEESFAYCRQAFAGMTDAKAAETEKFQGEEMPKLGLLATNSLHTIEHYGNLVTYMRMKGLVPPTSDPQFMKEMMK